MGTLGTSLVPTEGRHDAALLRRLPADPVGAHLVSVRHTALLIATPLTCSGHIDGNVSERRANSYVTLPLGRLGAKENFDTPQLRRRARTSTGRSNNSSQ